MNESRTQKSYSIMCIYGDHVQHSFLRLRRSVEFLSFLEFNYSASKQLFIMSRVAEL